MKNSLVCTLTLSVLLLWGCRRAKPPEPLPSPSATHIVTPSATPKVSDREIDTWAFQLQEIKIDELVEQNLDLVVLEPHPDGEDQPGLTADDLKRLKDTGMKVLAYLSVGEAEDYRAYWQDSWDDDPPEWLGQENLDWAGNFQVEYWTPEWQALMIKAIQSRVDDGYDGVYLDLVDAYEAFEDEGRETARQEMIDFVVKLAKTARQSRSEFQIFVQNAEALTTDEVYLNTIDGLGREELYYGFEGADNEQTPREETQAMLEDLERIKKAGKIVLTVEYTNRPEQIKKATESIRRAGFVPYFAPRDLDALATQGA